MRVLFVGSVQFSEAAFRELLNLDAEIVGLITKESSKFNSDHVDLAPLARGKGIPVLHESKINEPAPLRWIQEKKPDVIYCFGWSELIKRPVLDASPLGVVGFHPAALPSNRGRHPLIWALALGLTETASTFFFMDEGADSGDILSQEKIPLFETDYARDLYDRTIEVAMGQIRKFHPALSSGQFIRKRQDHSVANSWRKRGAADGRIDFRMTARSIYNLVRALSEPYVGAHIETPQGDVKVWRAEVAEGGPRNFEPGKVLALNQDQIRVQCGEGSIILMNHEFPQTPEVGHYL